MKRNLTLLSLIFVLCSLKFSAQTFNALNLTGFNYDVIAESKPAAASTNSSVTIDAGYVLYSTAYNGTVTGVGGLATNRTYSTSTRSYSLAPYNDKNTLRVGFNVTDSLTLSNPGNFSVVSLLGFSTVVDAVADITIKFTDGTSAVYNSKTFYNWSSTSQPAFISGFGKTNRSNDAVYYTSTEPKMFTIDLPIACANQSKMVSKILVKNNTNTSFIYLFAAASVNLPSFATTTIPVACKGSNTGFAKVLGIDSYGPLTYSWNSSPVQNTQTATNLPAGNYTVTINDGNGCVFTKSVSITEAATSFSVTSISTNSVSCASSTSTVNLQVVVSGGVAPYTYLWSNGSTVSSTSGTVGNYTVVATDALGCSLTATTSITAPTVLVSVNTSSLLCKATPNATATVSSVTGATGPFTYTWTTTPVQTAATATALAAGSYSVLVKDAAGCVTSQAFTILAPDFTLTQANTTCTLSTGSATVSSITGGSGAPYTYVWSSSATQTTNIATGIPAGSYSVTVKDAANCSIIKTFTISAINPTLAVTTSSLLCGNSATGSASVAVTGGLGGPYTYTWSATPSQTTATASNLAAGLYTVTVKGISGCIATQTFTIDKPSLTIATNSVTCKNLPNGSATVTAVNGGTAPYTYYWNASTIAGTSTINALGINSFTVNVIDANNCIITGLFSINGPSTDITAVVTTTNATCSGINNGKSMVAPVGGVAPYNYSWSTNPVQTTALAINLASLNIYTCTIIDFNNCMIRKTDTIYPAPQNINIIANPSTTICPAATVTLSVNGGASTYTWSTGAHTTSISATPSATNTVYTFTGTTNAGCMVSGSTAITTSTNAIGCVVGIKEQTGNVGFNLYPNPNNGQFVLVLGQTIENSTLEVFDALGKLVLSQAINGTEVVVNTTSLHDGIYFVTVKNKDQILVRTKIIKQ